MTFKRAAQIGFAAAVIGGTLWYELGKSYRSGYDAGHLIGSIEATMANGPRTVIHKYDRNTDMAIGKLIGRLRDIADDLVETAESDSGHSIVDTIAVLVQDLTPGTATMKDAEKKSAEPDRCPGCGELKRNGCRPDCPTIRRSRR